MPSTTKTESLRYRILRVLTERISGGVIYASILFCTVSGCMIISYGPEVVEPSQPSTKTGIVGFFFYTGATNDPTAKPNSLPVEFRLLQEALENRGGFAAAIVSTPPFAKGIQINVYETVLEQSPASKIFCSVSLLTLTAIPCYSASEGYLVQYDVFLDGELKKTYRYEIHETRAQWIVLLPVMWLNGLAVDYRQAFQSTIYQFLRDGRADGYLPGHAAPTS